MRLTNRELLRQYMAEKDFTQARLGRYAGVSRQFIWSLLEGEKSTCSESVGQRIEEAFGLLHGTLFLAEESPKAGRSVKPRKRASAA